MILVSKLCRGDIIEYFHIGYAVAIDEKGELLFSAGEPEYPVFIRSAANPFIAVALLESGAVEKYKLNDEEIAIICASHNGEAFQTEVVNSILKKIGLTIEDLSCGIHPPFDRPSYEQLILQGRRATAVHNNCSGKHAGMLAISRALGVAPDNYIDIEHPVQQRIYEKIKFYSEKDRIPIEVDNCNAPTFFLPLYNLALMYRKLVMGADDYLQRIFHIMNLHPKHVGGKGRFDTDFMIALGGKGLSKIGSEGVRGIGIRTDSGKYIGIAIKVLSGSWKATDSVSIAVLKHLRLVDDEILAKLDKYYHTPLKSYSDKDIGRFETEVVVEEAG